MPPLGRFYIRLKTYLPQLIAHTLPITRGICLWKHNICNTVPQPHDDFFSKIPTIDTTGFAWVTAIMYEYYAQFHIGPRDNSTQL